MHLLELKNVSIFEQLQIEEALLRADDREWCLVNRGSSPAIVMGISGKPEQLLNLPRVQAAGIPLIKRFSGGGTVVVDEQTFFVTFIRNGQAFPKEILEWSANIYCHVFPGMALRENDYVFGTLKFGGNAQYIQKGRWLHHTSFLWDYDPERMALLKLPPKRPSYRGERDHREFLCTLKERALDFEKILGTLREHLPMTSMPLEEARRILARPHRKATTYTKS